MIRNYRLVDKNGEDDGVYTVCSSLLKICQANLKKEKDNGNCKGGKWQWFKGMEILFTNDLRRFEHEDYEKCGYGTLQDVYDLVQGRVFNANFLPLIPKISDTETIYGLHKLMYEVYEVFESYLNSYTKPAIVAGNIGVLNARK